MIQYENSSRKSFYVIIGCLSVINFIFMFLAATYNDFGHVEDLLSAGHHVFSDNAYWAWLTSPFFISNGLVFGISLIGLLSIGYYVSQYATVKLMLFAMLGVPFLSNLILSFVPSVPTTSGYSALFGFFIAWYFVSTISRWRREQVNHPRAIVWFGLFVQALTMIAVITFGVQVLNLGLGILMFALVAKYYV